MRPSQNLPLPPRIYPLLTTRILCDAPRIYPSFVNLSPFNNYMQHSQYISLHITPFQQQCYYATLPVSPSLPEYTLPLSTTNMRHYQKLPLPPRIHPLFRQLYNPPPPSFLEYPSSPFYNNIRYSKNLTLSH